MTTIVIDPKTAKLVSDSQVSDEDAGIKYSQNKVYPVPGGWLGAAGAVVGGLLLGLIESIGSGYLGDLTGGVLGSHYTDILAFIVLIAMLTLRPSGLLGERVADRA